MAKRILEADCSSCAGLCCVAPAFAKSSDFAIDKPAGRACPNLADDFRCSIHEHLAERGFRGCIVFDCFGAGQRITEAFASAGKGTVAPQEPATPRAAGRPEGAATAQETATAQDAGRGDDHDWRTAPDLAAPMFAALPVMRQLHELLWLITEALKLDEAARLHATLRAAFASIDDLAAGELRGLDVDAVRSRVNPLLQRASELARSRVGGRRPDHRGANLIGRRMRGADLRGASFRGALLLGADLRDADLRRADFTGADLRGTDLRGANLEGALFLTKSQLRAAVT